MAGSVPAYRGAAEDAVAVRRLVIRAAEPALAPDAGGGALRAWDTAQEALLRLASARSMFERQLGRIDRARRALEAEEARVSELRRALAADRAAPPDAASLPEPASPRLRRSALEAALATAAGERSACAAGPPRAPDAPGNAAARAERASARELIDAACASETAHRRALADMNRRSTALSEAALEALRLRARLSDPDVPEDVEIAVRLTLTPSPARKQRCTAGPARGRATVGGPAIGRASGGTPLRGSPAGARPRAASWQRDGSPARRAE
jgi:hypothetical protein